MTTTSIDSRPSSDAIDASSPLQRRHWVLGIGAVGAAAIAAKSLPGAVPAAPVVAAVQPAAETSGGYRLTAHVQRYYDSAKS